MKIQKESYLYHGTGKAWLARYYVFTYFINKSYFKYTKGCNYSDWGICVTVKSTGFRVRQTWDRIQALPFLASTPESASGCVFVHSVTLSWRLLYARHCSGERHLPVGPGRCYKAAGPEPGTWGGYSLWTLLLFTELSMWWNWRQSWGTWALPLWVYILEQKGQRMTECWEAGKASGACPGGGGGTWLSQAEGAGQRIRHPLIPRPPVPSFSYLCCWQEASYMKSMAFYYDVGGLAAARAGVPFTRIGCFKTPAE